MNKNKILLAILLAIIVIFSLSCGIFPETTTTNATTTTPINFQVTFLDVGQADSILIQAGSSTMLIDAGTNSVATSLVNELQSMGVKRIDVLVGTHPHEDHIGGMDAVINKFDIGTIYMPEAVANTKTFEDVLNAIDAKNLSVTSPLPGSIFDLGPATCTILAPNSAKYDDMNNYSIVIRMVYKQTSFLFTGDAEVKSENEILDKGYTVRADVLKVGHHGSTSSTGDEFLKSVSPKYAVIMVGKDNDYGHPHQETLDKLKAAGVKIYRTDLNGNITFTSDGNNLTIKTEK